MTTARWSPLGAGHDWRPPKPGDVFALDHAVWRVDHAEPSPHDDGNTYLHVQHLGGARPESAPDDWPGVGRLTIPTKPGWTWHIYPSGRWPRCSCCGDPMPCRAEEQDREVSAALTVMETLSQRMPGCCWACGQPITSRQKAVSYPGDNLDLPGGPPVKFHTRGRCPSEAEAYELRWIAADPRRQRILTYPRCGGLLIIHADRSDECRPSTRDTPAPDCQGHSSHDHASMAACYAAARTGCPRGCARTGHPGAAPSPRPDRRDQGVLT